MAIIIGIPKCPTNKSGNGTPYRPPATLDIHFASYPTPRKGKFTLQTTEIQRRRHSSRGNKFVCAKSFEYVMELQSVVKRIDKRQALLTRPGAAVNGPQSLYCLENLPYFSN